MSKYFDFEAYAVENLIGTKPAGTGQLMAECPWCNRFGGFYIDRKTGHYVCHKCDEKGRHLVGVIAAVEDITWFEAKRFMMRNSVNFRRKGTILSLAEKIRMLRSSDDEGYEGDDDVEVELPKEFQPVFKEGRWAFPAYLKERGIKRETAKAWGLGFCNSGVYGHRILIPINCPQGRSFTARAVDRDVEPKIKNPKDANHGKLILGWDMLKEEGQDVALVEGPFDAIKTWQNGIQALSLMGKVLHEEQLNMISRWPRNTSITIMLDPEERLAPYTMARQLAGRFDNVYIARLPAGIDPGEATKKQAQTAYENAEKYDGTRQGPMLERIFLAKQRLSEVYAGQKK